MIKSVIVLGIGRFGERVATKLFEDGLEVMAVDKDYDLVQNISDKVTSAVQCDISNDKALEELGIGNFDVAVIATGESLEASMAATLFAKDHNVEKIIAKATSTNHARILKKIGADQIVFPEIDMGEKLARSIVGSNLLQFFHFSDDYSMIELKAYDELVGKSLKEIDFRKKYKMMVIAYKRDGELIINPEANWKIEKDDTLVLLGDSEHADKLQKEVDKYK
ncbi:MAG: TrkA family potassium uptake protein [Anaerococcus vaginalis]|uniref:potassium channel family protein n=1 Tax=Anaerococcus vaginalis TaxID=33037 RepID=UPI002909F368|nr:TrkA family potassium uptake protein [Anaerococcus vaginalis]MDU6181765.1 TrkA family potassium uptake protein [Anaerococcus vaginalis]MDU6546698.1 TrkA family potassium uptake protein [Anaerococcus vaginalis]MDU7650915.1 TrkA family potassium uptake protein [Anaerococcus vaginalis]